MTRKGIYRLSVAMKMLLSGSFAAYWWILPRRMKKIRTQADLRNVITSQIMARWLSEEFRRHQTFNRFIRAGEIAPIREQEFRLPFRVVA